MQELLRVEHLKKYFANQKAVDDISFEVAPGQIFGLLGPNGAGKTTLIRMITGIFYPDSGTITFQGKPFDPIHDVRHIGYMPEERGLYKKMKIGEHALYLAQLKGLPRPEAMKQVKHWFERLEMQSWWNKKVEDLSKGMSQKLQFVSAVLHEPKLIILDEPFSGLDPVNSNLIKDEIHRLAKNGSIILFSTHRMEQVEEICEHIILVNKGKKILDGTVGDVKQQYKQNNFRIGISPLTEDQIAQAPFDLIRASTQDQIVRIHEGKSTNEVLRFLLDHSISVRSFEELLPSLNEVFIRLVGDSPTARQFQSAP
ncbi:MAG: ABC transporter ATP-binding protein [Bacteroidetes bacterium]|nr:ABC transporter ATP-binding protein [Bacteroidota bacterium]